MEELSQTQIDRQDMVDNAIYQLFLELNPNPNKQIDWDIHWISEVREVVERVIVHEMEACDDLTFYPYLVEEDV